jgi:hypothetical protein
MFFVLKKRISKVDKNKYFVVKQQMLNFPQLMARVPQVTSLLLQTFFCNILFHGKMLPNKGEISCY